MIDPHAEVLMKVSGPVIPPCVAFGFGMKKPVRVYQPSLTKACERCPLAFGDVGSAMTCARVPHIDVFGRDIKIASKHQRRTSACSLVQPPHEPIKPHELGFVERRTDDSAVRRVDA